MAKAVNQNWLDSWPETVEQEVRDQTDKAAVYEMMTGFIEDKV